MTKSPATVFRFEVSLLDITPRIWRLIEVPDTYTFWDLHVAIQDAMGWLDYHLHAFVPVKVGKLPAFRIGIPLEPGDSGYIAGWTVQVAEHFTEVSDTARYDYDFGDDWSHEIKLVAVIPAETGVRYPRCIDGARACPPEDCGGLPGYSHLLETLSDPASEGHADMVRWLKGHAKNYYPYRPDEFDAHAVRFSDPKKRWNKMMHSGT